MAITVRNYQLNLLASKIGYNFALRHFRMTQEFVADVNDGFNLADVVNQAYENQRIEECQILPVVNLLLVDKYAYTVKSENLAFQVLNIDKLSKTVAEWTNLQVVLLYLDSNDAVRLLNPEKPDTWKDILPLNKASYLVCYVGALEDTSKKILESATSDVFRLLRNGSVRMKAGYRASSELKRFLSEEEETTVSQSPQTEAVVPIPVSGVIAKRYTAKLAVNVTNELFHNGNVEAWKRIIESYKLTFPHLDVLIWYEGERINDINALFKWGKVKHGVPILFSVAGENPAGLVKLKKYLFEGASPRFEAFLHGDPNSVLKLF